MMDKKYPSGIRLATAEDLDAIYKIELKSFPGPTAYSRRQLAHLVLRSNGTCLVESQGDVIRGFIIIAYGQRSLTGNIETVDVDPDFHSRGIGLKLLSAAHDDMRRLGMQWVQLEVSENNKPAIKLYKKAGYTFKERIEKYYRYEHCGTRDAIRMVKAL
jgi:ribosomal-protein-alanine N-acetyltransferase